MKRYLHNVLIALDQLLNALGNGLPTETVSSAADRARDKGRWWGIKVCAVMEWLDPGHGDHARASAIKRNQRAASKIMEGDPHP
jgi:hypothetical protein